MHSRGLAGGQEQFCERIVEDFHAIVEEFVGGFFHGDARFFEIGHDLRGARHVFGEAVAQLAVIAEGIESGGRDGVDGVGAN